VHPKNTYAEMVLEISAVVHMILQYVATVK